MTNNLNNAYTIADIDNESFFKIPQVIVYSPRFREMSANTKLAYAILRDRLSLSRKNGWYDENGRIYLNYTITNLVKVLNLSRSTVIKCKKELEKYELIADIQMGLNKANRIYISRIMVTVEDMRCIEEAETLGTSGSLISILPEKQAQTLDTSRKSKIYTSRSLKSRLQEVKKLDPNQTNVNQTDLIQTNLREEEEDKREASSSSSDIEKMVNLLRIADFQKIESAPLLLAEWIPDIGVTNVKYAILEAISNKRTSSLSYVQKIFQRIKTEPKAEISQATKDKYDKTQKEIESKKPSNKYEKFYL
jgi:hypothetical protein